MARSRLAISAGQSVTTCPSTHDRMSSLVSSASGATRPASARCAASVYSGAALPGPLPQPQAVSSTSPRSSRQSRCEPSTCHITSAPASVSGQNCRVVPESEYWRTNVVAYRF